MPSRHILGVVANVSIVREEALPRDRFVPECARHLALWSPAVASIKESTLPHLTNPSIRFQILIGMLIHAIIGNSSRSATADTRLNLRAAQVAH